MNTSKSLDEILLEILPVHVTAVISPEGNFYEKDANRLKRQRAKAAIVEAVEGLAPKPKDHLEEGINVAEENWRLGYYQAAQDFLQAIKEWQ